MGELYGLGDRPASKAPAIYTMAMPGGRSINSTS